ncbi:hypothetical protein FV222_07740 [Methylobacterium sp. WL103]|uniref:hypothetical protein n=1 Tax=Methylobacterium sp. WL103 TaxID=2603891 RepID=UPI0011C9822D|nr:hypothetical protein [Methylobacterium sp. WL103]TXN04292.1 hypothetical protein FV222_07740 [Methylobacterium sp. WL103]
MTAHTFLFIPGTRATGSDGGPMPSDQAPKVKRGLGFARFVLVVSSLSPLFLLWAIRGTATLSDAYWIPSCITLFLILNLFLWLLVRRARQSDNRQTFKISSARDQREHLLVYLFAMLIPLYDANMGSPRDLCAVASAFLFVAFLFWHLKLHYMNIIFAIKGYHIFTCEVQSATVSPDRDSPAFTTYAVISRRHRLEEGMTVSGLRLGGNVVVDVDRYDRARI